MTRATFFIVLIAAVGCACVAALSGQIADATPLRFQPGESVYFREAKNGLCIRLQFQGAGGSYNLSVVSAWIVPDQECRP